MRYSIVSGKRVEIPDAPVTPEKLAELGGVRPGRRIVKRTREGNYPLTPGQPIHVQEGDTFTDAPQRVKGR